MNRWALQLVLLLGAFAPHPLLAQEAASLPDSGERCSLTIRTEIDSAFVFINDRRTGRTPLTLDSLAPGTYRLRLVHPDVGNWLTGFLRDSVSLAPGERKTLSYRLGRYLAINSRPSGASLFIRDSLAGLTPILLWVDTTQRSSLFVLRKEGYREATVRPWEVSLNALSIGLVPEGGPDGRDAATESVLRSVRNPLRLWLSGAGTVCAGIAAAYLKQQADDRQAMYLSTGDPGLLAERRRLDNWSAVALLVTQIGFGLFTYFLLSD